MSGTSTLTVALRVLALGLRQGLLTAAHFDEWVDRHAPAASELTARFPPGLTLVELLKRIHEHAPTTSSSSPMGLRGYLGLLQARYAAAEIPRLDFYTPYTASEAERVQVEGVIARGTLDAYRLALGALEWFPGVSCRETEYLWVLSDSWNYERDDEPADCPIMCSILSLFVDFLTMYREVSLESFADWVEADRVCEARNAFLNELSGGRPTAAALEALRKEREDPDYFRRLAQS